ncbi:MAG: PEP-CTERM sorting domain-containing protein [Kiritimatiellae bacterium]|nr:PEP-CTERM sorting domain-containing protein [Kiritimatiellia bacterium]
MKTTLILVGLSIAVAVPPSFGDMIYNVSFEDPPHTLNAPVATGAGLSDRPDLTIGSVITRSGLADFSTQVASLEPAGRLRFFDSTPSSSGLVLLSWDLAMLSFGSGGGPNTGELSIDAGGGGSGTMIMSWQNDFDIVFASTVVGTFALNQQDHYELLLDLDNDRYDFALNGSPVLTNQTLGVSFNVQNVVFGAENLQDTSYAVDNFKWDVVPEPSTWLLFSTGCLAAVYGRRLLEAKAAGR